MGHKTIDNLKFNKKELNVLSYVSTDKRKRQKTCHLSPITLGYLHAKKGSRKTKHQERIKILIDSGCGDTIVNKSVVERLDCTRTKPSTWATKTGTFTTNRKCNITFKLPAFHKHRDITWDAHVDETPSGQCRYDLIIG